MIVCYTRSFDSYFFLGSLRISIFTLLEEIEDERGYPEIRKLFPLGKSGFIIVPEVRYNPNKGQFSMGNPTNFLCLKGVLYCFGIISVPDRAFLLKILSCTILPWIMIPVPHIPDTVAWGSHIIVFKFRVLSSGSDFFPWGQPNYTINQLKRQMCKFLFFQEFAHSFLI